ncbi:MAG: citrate synthase [Actinomycetota bacterium]|nr:citrate synthase [Actinomycetota bacterium]
MSETDSALTAEQAASRLGVKRQTLYAYVSRGLLSRTVALDGRTSLFDAASVDALRSQRRRVADGEVPTIIASSLTSIDLGGHYYRGRSVVELVANDEPFERVADLLWDDVGVWALDSDTSARVREANAPLPGATPLLDRLRITVALLSALDPLRNDLTTPSVAQAGRTMLLAMVAGLHKLHLGPRELLSDQLWLSLTITPGTADQRRALNAALVLLADHGLAASTFAVRIAASVRADPYSLVSTGLGAMGGVLHGGASAQVHHLFDQAHLLGADVVLGRELAAHRHLPGVGHAIYRGSDPRDVALFELIEAGWSATPRFEVVATMRELFLRRLPKAPNVDFSLGALTWLADMEPSAGQLFAIARTAGWIGHAIEELDEAAVRFRPVARYVGPHPNAHPL